MQTKFIPTTAVINQDRLVQLLSEAFNAGLGGYEDLCQDTVDAIAQRYFQSVAAEATRIDEELIQSQVTLANNAVAGLSVVPSATVGTSQIRFTDNAHQVYCNQNDYHPASYDYGRNAGVSAVQTSSYVTASTFSGPAYVNYRTYATGTGMQQPSIRVG